MKLGLALVAAALIACGVALAGPPERPVDRTCATRAEAPNRVPVILPRRDLVMGRAVFFGLRDGVLVPKARAGEDSVVKLGIAVRTGAPLTVRLTLIGAAGVALDYGGPGSGDPLRVADGQRAVRFFACPPSTRRFSDGRALGAWTGYTGGFLVAHPGCVRLRVTARGDRAVTRRVAIGVPLARCR